MLLLIFSSDDSLKIIQIRPSADNKVTVEELKAIIQVGTSGDAIEQIELDIVARDFNLGDRKLLTHRFDTIVVKTEHKAALIRSIVKC